MVRTAPRRVGAGVLALVTLAAICSQAAAAHDRAGRSDVSTRPSTSAETQVETPCRRPAPTTAAGYARMFSEVDPAQWGGADGAFSVPLPDGRTVWLFADTLSTRRFVHSSAIVQTGGCLHVSAAGAQLLPNDDAAHVYWISAARRGGGGILITARSIAITGAGPWDFRDTGYERVALVRVAGEDVRFVRWVSGRASPAPDPGPMLRIDAVHPHHFGYGRRTHPEARLAGGRTLVTICQNWDDGVLHPLSAYQPLFREQ